MADVFTTVPEVAIHEDDDDANGIPIPIIERSDSASPPPSLTPSLAISEVPGLDRSISTASSSAASSISDTASRSSRLSALEALEAPSLPVNKRRGYTRPQATNFAQSAKNRESVQSLGSIAHLQYYFARTGLLDGKGAQLARKRSSGEGFETDDRRKSSFLANNRGTVYFGSNPEILAIAMGETALPDSYRTSVLVDGPVEQEDEPNWDDEPSAMLPPTVSTYNHRPVYVPPPPDVKTLRKELLQTVEDACKVLEELHKSKTPSAPGTPKKNGTSRPTTATNGATEDRNGESRPTTAKDENQGMHEIQGLHLLDVTTLAIRAAKNYYTAHERPQRLYSIKSERKIRAELYQVLEVLKRMAGRNFAGGIRASEQNAILLWIVGISDLLKTEEDMERREQEERERWMWRAGEWEGKERERERLFLKSWLPAGEEELPEWTEPPPVGAEGEDGGLPTPFLARFGTGLLLVHIHNAAVRASKKQFEEITKWHTDTAKPYRCAENMRYWIKAAERRWDIKMNIDVMAVVCNDKGKEITEKAWRGFDAALLQWCKGVREEIVRDWEAKERATGQASPKTGD